MGGFVGWCPGPLARWDYRLCMTKAMVDANLMEIMLIPAQATRLRNAMIAQQQACPIPGTERRA